MKTFLLSSNRKLGIKTLSMGQSFRKPFTVWEIKHLGCPVSIYKNFLNCFNFIVKIRRATFGSVEDASDVITFPFCGNFCLQMHRWFSWFPVDFVVE